MNRQFAQKIEEMRRLIDGSASTVISRDPSPVVVTREPSPIVITREPGESRDLPPHSFLLAVSGGMDSMCMADLFLQSFGADTFSIAHCNFSLRGDESDGDEALVRNWTERNGVQLFVKRFDTIAYAHEKGVSIEMAARDLRYDWFEQLCREHGFVALSVAHNANDNAETLLLNLLRGTGLKGLHGISEISGIGVAGTVPVPVCRPLLPFTRKQIEGYVLAHRIPYRHDSSNFESDYKRNRIRNEVFPILEKINPSFVRTLNREIGYFSEAGSIVDDWCRSHMPDVVREQDGSRLLQIDIPALLATPYWRYLLYYILEPYGFNSQTLASIENLLLSDRTVSGKRFESQDYVLLTSRDMLRIMPKEYVPAINDDQIMVVRGNGFYNFNGRRFQVEVIDWTPDMTLKQPHGTLILDGDVLKFPFVCRRWRQGDWLIPLGMKGKKKVSDLFTDLKYDSQDKESAVMIVDTRTEGLAQQQHIAALLGLRIDDRYKVTPSTRSVIRISL